MTHEDGALIEAVLKLPDNYRIVVQLFYYEDYSVREIAKLLKIKEGTVTTQLNRARRKIKKMLDRGEC
jgi:RNA polymerase sigma-70 factor (ECF subfamily)